MTRRSPTRKRPAVDAEPRSDGIPSGTPPPTTGGIKAFMESAAQEILVVTYWFDPAPHSDPYPVTVRFSGRRVDMKKGRVRSDDKFVQDETIEKVVPGSGPISVTARVHGINPGPWAVTAHQLSSTQPDRGPRKPEDTTPAVGSGGPVTRFWHRWAPDVSSIESVSTCLVPFARVPGILPGIWGAMVALGMIIALALQALVISVDHLAVGRWWLVALLAIVVGIVGAKVWYIVLKRREHSFNGWCIQGFITGAILTTVILLVALDIPAGAFLDATAPGLLLAMAIGRIGCFFAGCCGGPPTASRFSVWSSDQRVGARRLPTQLLESALAGIVGLLVLVGFLNHGPAGGAFFVAGLAAYTLGRQGILYLRAEPRKTRQGGLVTATLAAMVLIAAVGCLSHLAIFAPIAAC